LSHGEIFTGFTLKSLRDYPYESLLGSQIPEEIILAILCDYKKQKSVEVIRQILMRLKGMAEHEIVLRKYIRQLSILARLRNLTEETHKQIQDMGLTYDITEDYLYQEGQKSREKNMIIKMLKDKTLSIEKIAEIAEVTVDYVKQVAKELKK
jgi:hypothetical protein